MTSPSNLAPTPELQAARTQAGALLRAAREAAGRSPGELATQLKVSGDKIEALESGAWERLPDPTFARGLLRAAAKMVKADAEAIMQVLAASPAVSSQASLEAAPARRPLPAAGNGPAHGSRKLWWLAVLAIVLAALVIFFLPRSIEMNRWLAAFHASGQLASKPGANGQPQPPASAPGAGPHVAPVANTAASAAASSPAQAAVPAASPQIAASGATGAAAGSAASLSLQATADSWIQVRTQQGKVLYSGIVPASGAQVVPLAAQDLPVKLIVGNASHTQVMFNGQPVNLAARTVGNVARLTLPQP
jgi:cytoskeleton protein RodZ